MNPKLIQIWFLNRWDGEQAIRVEFDNNRYHEVLIGGNRGADNVAEAMLQLARMIGTDPRLKPKPPEKREVLVEALPK